MLDHAIGPNVLKRLLSGIVEAMERNNWTTLDDFIGLRRDRIVAHSEIRRHDAAAYHGGYEAGLTASDSPAGRTKG
jgi:hypothetical protein